jgi:hypothetical protein
MMESESENGSQIGNLIRSDLIVLSAAQMLLSNIDLHLPLKDIYQHLLNIGHITLIPSYLIKSSFTR